MALGFLRWGLALADLCDYLPDAPGVRIRFGSEQMQVKTMEPTLNLRAKKTGTGTRLERYFIQQLWVCQETGEREWRALPKVDETASDNE